MHVPDHLINNVTELAAGLAATGVVAAGAFRKRSDSEHSFAPTLATAALVFAIQMVNFPVVSGTSGHLLGGALATALVGPRRALLAVSSVVITQALVFADGGIGALGINLWLIAIIPVGVAAALRSLKGDGPMSTAVAAALSAPVSALTFVGLYALGGAQPIALSEMLTSMLSVHLLIGLGEAAITTAVLWTISAVRNGTSAETTPVWGAAVISATMLSLVASSQPDGLEYVGAKLGFAVTGPGSILASSPLAGYELGFVDGNLSVAAAGLLGLVATCAICATLNSTKLGRRATIPA